MCQLALSLTSSSHLIQLYKPVDVIRVESRRKMRSAYSAIMPANAELVIWAMHIILQ